jgi:hypothetical protein
LKNAVINELRKNYGAYFIALALRQIKLQIENSEDPASFYLKLRPPAFISPSVSPEGR